MATFSENQVRQLYVATGLKGADTHLVAGDALGKIEVFPGAEAGEHMYFEYMSHDGIVRSDLINTLDIVSVTRTLATDMQRKLKKATLKLSTDAIKLGVDYIAKVNIMNYIGMSDADTVSLFGEVRATSAMAGAVSEAAKKDKFYKALAESLALNASKVASPLVAVYVHSTGTTTSKGFDSEGNLLIVPGKKMDYQSVVDIDSIVIKEVEQPWTLGKFAQEAVNFKVQVVPAGKAGEEDPAWATIKYEDDSKVINNGKKIADLEWFCKGERGDIYRGVNYPNDFKYKGVADEDTAYDVIDVVYNYVGNNEDVQKSRKVISIAINNSDATTLLGRIEAGAGLTPAA